MGRLRGGGRSARRRSLGLLKLSDTGKLKAAFGEYLDKTSQMSFRIAGTNNQHDRVSFVIEYGHRWSNLYVRKLMARMMRLEEAFQNGEFSTRKATLITMTTYGRGSYSTKARGKRMTVASSLELLQESRTKIMKWLRKYHPRVDYFWVLEPHKSGQVHCHLLVLCELSEEEEKKIQSLWSEKYKAGSKKHGMKITKAGDGSVIKSLKNYLLKYLRKAVAAKDDWTSEEELYNAVLWASGARGFGCSARITSIMKLPRIETGIVWDEITLLSPGTEQTIWSKEDGRLSKPGSVLDYIAREDVSLERDALNDLNWVVKESGLWDSVNKKKLPDTSHFEDMRRCLSARVVKCPMGSRSCPHIAGEVVFQQSLEWHCRDCQHKQKS